MTDSEINRKISITYLPPPLGSLQTGGLKADDRPGSPLKGALGGVEGVGDRVVSKFGSPHHRTACPKPCERTLH